MRNVSGSPYGEIRIKALKIVALVAIQAVENVSVHAVKVICVQLVEAGMNVGYHHSPPFQCIRIVLNMAAVYSVKIVEQVALKVLLRINASKPVLDPVHIQLILVILDNPYNRQYID